MERLEQAFSTWDEAADAPLWKIAGPIRIHYLEAYCRPGSTDREWGQTVIKHKAELVSESGDVPVIRLKDTLEDGVIVNHTITASHDEVDFQLAVRTAQTSNRWVEPSFLNQSLALVRNNSCLILVDVRVISLRPANNIG